MKQSTKLIIVLLITMYIFLVAFTSCKAQCGDDVTAWGIGMNLYSHQYPGLSVEKAYLAQNSKIGISMGVAGAPIRYQQSYLRVTDGKEERGTETVTKVNGNIWAEGLYKIRQVDYAYSINLVVGTGFDGYTGISAHTGINIRFPRDYKAFYIQAVYRTDHVLWLRTGIYLP